MNIMNVDYGGRRKKNKWEMLDERVNHDRNAESPTYSHHYLMFVVSSGWMPPDCRQQSSEFVGRTDAGPSVRYAPRA